MSGGIRADWKLAEALADDDPFAAVVYTTGIEIDLTAPEEELSAQLAELVVAEGDLLRRGVHCDLKDGGQDCLSCPSATLDNARRLSQLCRVGKDEHAVWAAGEALQSVRMGSLLELATIADEMSEIGHMDAALAEMLVAAGL